MWAGGVVTEAVVGFVAEPGLVARSRCRGALGCMVCCLGTRLTLVRGESAGAVSSAAAAAVIDPDSTPAAAIATTARTAYLI